MRMFSLVLLACLAAGCGARPTVADRSAAGPSKSWRLAYVGAGGIWVANGNGTGARLVIKDGEAPAWSRDHRRLAFARGGNVWVANADGTGQQRLTKRWQTREAGSCAGAWSGRSIAISWHPSGERLVFSHPEQFQLQGGSYSGEVIVKAHTIFELGLPQGEPELYLDLADDGASYSFSDQHHPAWSPDGKRLAFSRNGDLWMATLAEPADPPMPAAFDVTRAAAAARYDAPTYRCSRENVGVAHTCWSPDGRYLAYALTRQGGSGTAEIWLLDTRRWQKRLLQEGGLDPCFSPDGRWLAYHQDLALVAMSLSTRRVVRLAKEGWEPAW